LGSANIIAARVTGAHTKVLAAVIRGAVAPTLRIDALNKINVPVLILNRKPMSPIKYRPRAPPK